MRYICSIFPLKCYQNTKWQLCSNIILLLNLYMYIRPQQIWNHFSKQTSHLKAADNNYCYNSYAVLKKQ